jgi:hypothetical protein
MLALLRISGVEVSIRSLTPWHLWKATAAGTFICWDSLTSRSELRLEGKRVSWSIAKSEYDRMVAAARYPEEWANAHRSSTFQGEAEHKIREEALRTRLSRAFPR